MTDPILHLLSVLTLAMLLLAAGVGLLPAMTAGLAIAGICGLGALLCLPVLLGRLPSAIMTLPAGPPGLSFHLGLDALSAYTLFLVLAAGGAVAAWQAYAEPQHRGMLWRSGVFLAGAMLSLLAADAVSLTIGVTLACGALWLDPAQRQAAPLLIPLLVLAAVGLLTPPGFAPRFDAIRAAPAEMIRATPAVILAVAAAVTLIALPLNQRCATRQALRAGLMMPLAIYLLLRLAVELPAAGARPVWGFLLILAGGVIAVWFGWVACASRHIDAVAAAFPRGQAGLAMIGAGLTILSRLADLPTGSGDAMAGGLLLLAGCLPATTAVLATQSVAAAAGTYRLSRLGGLQHLVATGAAALSGGLFAFAALPPSLGFAGMWLLLRALVAAPRSGGLPTQIPLALVTGSVALASVLATTGGLRLAGVAILGRPRSPRGASAQEPARPVRIILLTMAGASLLMGIVPGLFLWLLADPILLNLAGVEAVVRGGPFGAVPGYLALPTAALLGACFAAVLAVRLWRPRDVRVTGAWLDGAVPPQNLPFGDPLAQSVGEGFIPDLPLRPRWRRPVLPPLPHPLPHWRLTPSQTGFLLILAGAAACLIILALGSSIG